MSTMTNKPEGPMKKNDGPLPRRDEPQKGGVNPRDEKDTQSGPLPPHNAP